MNFKYEDNRIYTVDKDGTLLGEIVFPTIDEDTDTVLVERTFVNPIARGQGLAAKLVAEFYEYAKQRNLHVQLLCPYAKKAFEKHPEYQELLTDREN
ncbi:GNAT family N-acetyltransferase [Paucilactobacillus suebicus]|uniref:Uncharacterized protein n=1 Tax=Paucilactobacillus suebicus DSM 5007 = KCTC 3549 TaxID=1423807 RepID=A0A0R1W032_9LACO|nr:GNAT family N-acetyltransferase [Paucilactobacillus suebicus]KRM10981.1 hypothetical protein FD16_GL001015 [Paucilactobacillus suebicus DSM 5007 = KCTC 3549]